MLPLSTLVLFVLMGLIPSIEPPATHAKETSGFSGLNKQLKTWTDKFGDEIYSFGNIVTKYPDIQKRFQTSPNSELRYIDLKRTVEEMANFTYATLKEKTDAIRKIMLWAEQRALEHYEKPEESRANPPKEYLNAKKINYEPPVDMSAKEVDNAKEKDPLLNQTIDLKDDDHFSARVNLTKSCVHVPSSIFDRRGDILDGIDWSSGMDEVFRSNYHKDATLLWQYFGSSTGFFRQYPAMKWPNHNSNKNKPDMYDCRTRPWYTAAANSPKNIVILQDTSGSMTGLRREIAKHVVYTILDTLTDNDYVNVLNFTDETHPVVPCFKDSLIQANLQNVREFKVALDQDRTIGMSNFTEALETAYNILEKHRNLNRSDSAHCNEAIMLITDGAPELFKEIFDPRNKEKKGRTRVFTYLIGREVTDHNEVLEIACSNKGYFTHVTTLGEVQEQVLKYLAVMSRPMVMEKIHTVAWTPVYADIVEISESDWLWEDKTKERQGKRSERYKTFLKLVLNKTEGQEFYVSNPDDTRPPGKKDAPRIAGIRVLEYLDHEMTKPQEEDLRRKAANEEREEKKRQTKTRQLPSNLSPSQSYLDLPRTEAITAKKQHEILRARNESHEAEKENLMKWGPGRKFRFMVSVSMPVFDQRNATKSKMSKKKNKELQANETHSNEEPAKDKIAIFLGVVGTDIPIAEFQKVSTPFKVGVNGYAFAITENGYVLFHPEWKPLHTDLLKPNYNAVDLSQIEHADSDYSRNLDPKLLEMRKEMQNMETGTAKNRSLNVRVPQDEFKRVTVRKQRYAYTKIPTTPYILGITVPDSHRYKFHGQIELRRDGLGKNVSQYFEGPRELRQWKVNPDWTYCEYIRGGGSREEKDKTKEGLVIHFLREIQNAKNSWAWSNTGIGVASNARHPSMTSDIYSCDKDLVQSLVFDANVTGVFNLKWLRKLNSTKIESLNTLLIESSYAKQIAERFGAVGAFIATRSGLTRWVNYTTDNPYSTTFMDSEGRATEELWYKRAVDRYEIDRGQSYVVSVPYDAGTRNDSLVTATRAIFVHRDGPGGANHRYAPVAVTGVKFEQIKLAQIFYNITSKCDGMGCIKCKPEFLTCYVLDENGYIVVHDAEYGTDAGRFLGEVDGVLMEKLKEMGIYKQVTVIDYQAMCLHLFSRSGFGMIFQNPFKYFQWMIKYFIGRLAWLALQINLHSYFSPDFSSVLAEAMVTIHDEQELEDNNPNQHPFLELASINKTRLRPCHKRYDLFTYGPRYQNELYTNGYHPGRLEDCDGGDYDGFFGVHLINRTNLIMVAVDSKCKRMRKRTYLMGKEVIYPIDEELENATLYNDVIAQICRIPYIHLDRKKPTAPCLYFNEDEQDLKPECGSGVDLKSTVTLMLLSIGILLFYSRLIRV